MNVKNIPREVEMQTLKDAENTTAIAFKEWACVVKALASGEQTLILRKGGIHEKNQKFEVCHSQFFLFPTYEHQKKEDLNDRGQAILSDLLREGDRPVARTVEIEYFFEVKRNVWIEDLGKLSALAPFHIWSDLAVKKRFEWGEKPGLFAILGRVYRLPVKTILEMKPAFGGCRSWVALGEKIEHSNLSRVMTDSVFEERLNTFDSTLI